MNDQPDVNPMDNVKYVGFWARVGASIIDSVLIVAVTLPIIIAVYGEKYFSYKGAWMGSVDFLLSYVFPIVAIVCFWVYKQATPGKMAVSAKVVDAKTGDALSLGQAILRYFCYLVSILPLFLGLMWVGWDKKKQGWHDKIAGTVVIRAED